MKPIEKQNKFPFKLNRNKCISTNNFRIVLIDIIKQMRSMEMH